MNRVGQFMTIASQSLTVASECDSYYKDELSCVDDNPIVTNKAIKTFKSFKIEDSLLTPG